MLDGSLLSSPLFDVSDVAGRLDAESARCVLFAAAARLASGTAGYSCHQAQETFTKALSDAILAYGKGDEARRAAYKALKQKFEKRGDAWIAKRDPAC